MKIRMSKAVRYPDPGGPHLPMFNFVMGELVDVSDVLGELILSRKHGILVVEDVVENKIVEPLSKEAGLDIELKDDEPELKDAPSAYNGLATLKRKKFVDEYLVDFDVTQAMIRAGYKESSAKSRGAELIKEDDILAAIKERSQ